MKTLILLLFSCVVIHAHTLTLEVCQTNWSSGSVSLPSGVYSLPITPFWTDIFPSVDDTADWTVQVGISGDPEVQLTPQTALAGYTSGLQIGLVLAAACWGFSALRLILPSKEDM